MLKHVWSVLCERVSVDRHTNLCSYLSCIEAVTTKNLPAVMQSLTYGCRWNKDDDPKEVLKVKLIVISPDGKEIPLVESAESVIERKNHRLNIILDGMSFKHAGVYTFRLKRNIDGKWSKVHDTPLSVVLKGADKEVDKFGEKSKKVKKK